MSGKRSHHSGAYAPTVALQSSADVQVAMEAPCQAYVSFADVAAMSRQWLWERLWATAVQAARVPR